MVEPQFSKLMTRVRFPSPAWNFGQKDFAGIAQLVEHLHGKEKVVGSIPIPSFSI